jgi:uncharacterized coiled-coil protein SlyX
MYRKGSVNERLEGLEQKMDANEAIQEFVDEKLREQLELLEERIADLEGQLVASNYFRYIPKKTRLKLIADQREGQQESTSEEEELISVEE